MKPMNIKKLASLLFQRSVIVAALILVQAALIIGGTQSACNAACAAFAQAVKELAQRPREV